jgi:arabinogalactan endo-1,4-beta-galactosidase
MKAKKIKVINKLDKLDAIINYIFLKQSSIENSCNLFPKTLNEINIEVCKILSQNNDFIVSINNIENVSGVGIFYNEPNEKYIECLGGFFNDESDFRLMMEYLKKEHNGHHIDFIFPLENINVLSYLKNINGIFDKPEICLEVDYKSFIKKNCKINITELSKENYEPYLKIHNDQNIYWTGKRIIEAPELFKVFIILNKGKIEGYINITYGRQTNEIYKLFVEKENIEYMEALINAAVTNVLYTESKLVVLVDLEDINKINLYKNFGFTEKYTSQTVSIDI